MTGFFSILSENIGKGVTFFVDALYESGFTVGEDNLSSEYGQIEGGDLGIDESQGDYGRVPYTAQTSKSFTDDGMNYCFEVDGMDYCFEIGVDYSGLFGFETTVVTDGTTDGMTDGTRANTFDGIEIGVDYSGVFGIETGHGGDGWNRHG